MSEGQPHATTLCAQSVWNIWGCETGEARVSRLDGNGLLITDFLVLVEIELEVEI